MFATANKIARDFTKPIVISSRRNDGKCEAAIGTYVIINEDGWFVTAFHIIDYLLSLFKKSQDYEVLLKKKKEIEEDKTKNPNVRRGLINRLNLAHDTITNASGWFGEDGLVLEGIHPLPAVDLVIGRFNNFNKQSVNNYPIFKDYSKSMDCGTSLCKLGFPFHSIVPSFDEARGFVLPEGAVPLPLFPIEGIFTRTVFIQPPDNYKLDIPLKYIETSSPGLKGQSGGPTFDINGTIWAIQSKTQHYALGFGDNTAGLSNREAEHLKNQYLNVGWGIHSESIIKFCELNKIKIKVSDY